jgi:uncharacterized protein YndB with AHSA1/START domain
MDKPQFVHVSYIATTPEKLWAALTNPEFTRQYWGGRSIQSDWKVGSPVRHVRADGGWDWEGEVLECEPPRVLSYTWKSTTGEKDTRVTFKIEQTPTVLRLVVTHEGFEPGSKGLQQVTGGWQAILSSLKTLLETGKPLDFSWWRS